MDKNQLDEYKREMMKLYGQRRTGEERIVPVQSEETVMKEEINDNMSVPEDGFQDNVSPEIEEIDPEAADDTSWSGFLEKEPNDLDERFPDPDLSELESENIVNNPAAENDLGTSVGFILVNVRAGDESFAIEGAVVVVSAIINGTRLIIATGIADNSGTAPLFEVPVPDPSFSQQPFSETRPYSLYDISVTAKGFFNARSVDVPVFSGITSIQNFNMIPVPLMMKETDETLTIYNQEPFFGTSAGQEE